MSTTTTAITYHFINPKPTQCLRPHRIPRGKITLIIGVGKSLLTLHLATRPSHGVPFPKPPASASQPLSACVPPCLRASQHRCPKKRNSSRHFDKTPGKSHVSLRHFERFPGILHTRACSTAPYALFSAISGPHQNAKIAPFPPPTAPLRKIPSKIAPPPCAPSTIPRGITSVHHSPSLPAPSPGITSLGLRLRTPRASGRAPSLRRSLPVYHGCDSFLALPKAHPVALVGDFARGAYIHN
jgi:hypothetical protein